MRQRFTQAVGRILDEDSRVALVLADIGLDRFVEEGILTRHRARVVNVGIREQLMIGVAAGLALEGFRPIVHTIAPFLVERAFEQIKLDLSHQDLGAVLVSVGASYDYADSGRTHHAPGDVALLQTLPGWDIHVPGHPDEAEALLRRAASGSGRGYIRLSERTNRRPVLEVMQGPVVVREGATGSPVVIAIGPMLDPVIEATEGMDLRVLYTTGAELRDPSVVTSTDATDFAVVEPALEGTSVPSITRCLQDRPHRLLGVGVPRAELRRYGTASDHDRAHGLDPSGIRRRLSAFLAGDSVGGRGPALGGAS